EEAERAARTQLAVHGHLTAEPGGDLAADRQAETGTAVAAASGPVALLEGGEDAGEVVRADADAGVGHREHDPRPGVRSLRGRGLDQQLDVAPLGELDRVGQQVVDDL